MFSPSLSWWPPEDWPENSPDNLLDICLDNLISNPSIIFDYDADSELYSLRSGITLPSHICEALIAKWADSEILDEKFLHIFKNTERTKLSRLNLSESQVCDKSFEWIMKHKPREVNIDMCDCLTTKSLETIQENSDNLVALYVGNNSSLFSDLSNKLDDDVDFDNLHKEETSHCEDIEKMKNLFKCPRLQALSVHGLIPAYNLHYIPAYNCMKWTLNNLKSQLVYLDISECELNYEPCILRSLGELENLSSLILYDVDIKPSVFSQIRKLKKLRVMDLSQSRDDHVFYDKPEELLKNFVSDLPRLTHLDMSGTNLPGFLKPKEVSHALRAGGDNTPKEQCAIPGLEGRHFEFLGLFNCPYEACRRENIPSKQVAGDANEEQVILAIQKYVTKSDLLLRCLNNLFQMCRYSECRNQRVALQAILEAMKKHPGAKTIQISGSASLFYICKSDDKHNFSAKVRRVIVRTLLDGMENHQDETIMLRNACLTLCHFKIPQDVMFEYERVVRVLLQIVRPPNQEEFVQHVGIFLLNSLACQVDGREKQLVGDLGAIQTMLSMIEVRLKRGVCDEVMEIAWSTMWNVTDETPVNCERFIEGDGMELFLQCLQKFPDKDELLRNMMGLMGNVAEVAYLRPRLMESEYVSIFCDLLDSSSDGIEVSYNACGVLAHMVSDGASTWNIDSPRRKHVLSQMISAISRWKLNTKRNINYRSFEPILRLVPKYDTPECQHWAVWALCNLTRMYRKKYCDLVEKELGLPLLENIMQDPRPFKETKELALSVIRRCKIYKENHDYESDDEEDRGLMEEDDE